MLKRCIDAEWIKLRRSRLSMILFALPVFSVLIGCANYALNREALAGGWYSLWTQISLFYGEFFLPVLVAICSAYMCRLEHLNKNWNAVMAAPITAAHLFLAKLIVVGALLFLVQLLFLSLYYAAGQLFGLSSPFPGETFGWVTRGWFASAAIASIQLGLSMRIRSFAVPIGISVCAVFIGLGLYVSDLGLFFPYSLLTIGMGVLSQESLSLFDSALFIAMTALFLVASSVFFIRWLKKTDVSA